ncbi:MAG: M48 family metallopeptidase [Rhodocyclaceae bacterium]|nr:M48 family metallopeptidase [Rhodocyclaceae bacterium]
MPLQLELGFDMPAPLTALPSITLGDQTLVYRLRRSQRRSIGLRIGDDGLTVSAPHWVGQADIDRALIEKGRWILRKLHEWRARTVAPQAHWQMGARLAYLGQPLLLVPGSARSVQCAHGELRLPLPADAPAARVHACACAWLRTEALLTFHARTDRLATAHGLKPLRIVLSAASTLWGSCTARGVVRLNWRLIHHPLHLIDYVIAHELAHLAEMNHSPAFWAQVARMDPDYAAARAELRKYRPDCAPAV